MIGKISGSGERVSTYEVPDDQMAAGSTFGSPKATLVIKATGAIEKFYSVDAGKTLVGSVVVCTTSTSVPASRSRRIRARLSFIRSTKNIVSGYRTA